MILCNNHVCMSPDIIRDMVKNEVSVLCLSISEVIYVMKTSEWLPVNFLHSPSSDELPSKQYF